MKAYTLLQRVSLYEILKRYRCKKDIPADKRQFNPLLVNFGLHGYWYVSRGPSGLFCVNGSQMPFHSCSLLTGEMLIARQDLTVADKTKYEDAWRESLDSAIREKAGIA